MPDAEIVVGKCRCGDWSRSFVGRTQGDGCVQGAGIRWELREWMGLRFWVDIGSKACDRERDVRGR